MRYKRMAAVMLAAVTALGSVPAALPAAAANAKNTTSASKKTETIKDEVMLHSKKYDFTGDGKTDDVKVVALGNNGSNAASYHYAGVEVYVGGRLSLAAPKLKGFRMRARLVKLPTKTFLIIECIQKNSKIESYIYGYKNGIISQYLTGEEMISTGTSSDGRPVSDYGYGAYSSSKANSITYKVQVLSPTIGNYECKVSFTYTSRKLRRSGRTYEISAIYTRRSDGKLKAAKNITGYAKPEGKKSATLKKGTVYRPDKVWIKGSKVYYHIPMENAKVKAVWIKGTTFNEYYKSLLGQTTPVFKGILLV